MSVPKTKDKHPDRNAKASVWGSLSIISGIIAIWSVMPVYGTFFVADLPIDAIMEFLFFLGLGLSLAGVFFGIMAIKERNTNRLFSRLLGVIGIFLSSLPLLSFCLLLLSSRFYAV
jgi:hypothetical protein